MAGAGAGADGTSGPLETVTAVAETRIIVLEIGTNSVVPESFTKVPYSVWACVAERLVRAIVTQTAKNTGLFSIGDFRLGCETVGVLLLFRNKKVKFVAS